MSNIDVLKGQCFPSFCYCETTVLKKVDKPLSVVPGPKHKYLHNIIISRLSWDYGCSFHLRQRCWFRSHVFKSHVANDCLKYETDSSTQSMFNVLNLSPSWIITPFKNPTQRVGGTKPEALVDVKTVKNTKSDIWCKNPSKSPPIWD